jgi:hypothetical protein
MDCGAMQDDTAEQSNASAGFKVRSLQKNMCIPFFIVAMPCSSALLSWLLNVVSVRFL